MTTEIERTKPVDVTRFNPRDSLFVRGSEVIDGSIRFAIDEDDPLPQETHIELLTLDPISGEIIHNDTGLRVASASLSLGHDLRVGAAGGFIETFNVSEIDDHIKSLLPHIQFDQLGTTGPAHMPILDKRENFIIFPGPATGEIIASTIGFTFSAASTKLLHASTHTTGSVGATNQIRVSYYKGTDNTGSLLNRINIPSSVMPANTTFTITYEDDFGFENIETVFVEFVSSNNISMATNISGDIITTQNGHTLDELDMILDELVLANDLSLTFDNNLGFVVNNRFP